MKKIIIAMLAIAGLATYVQAQTAYDMNVKLKSGAVHTFAADDVEEVTFTEQEPVVEEEFNILTSVYIPDGNLLNYIKENIANGANVYTNLQAKNYRGIISLNAASMVTNFKGLEYFVNLDSLKIRYNNVATNLDLTPLKNLSYLQLMQCTKFEEVKIGNIDKIKFLDIMMCTKLTNLIQNSDLTARITTGETGTIDMGNRQNLEYLDVDAIPGITGVVVAGCTNLKHINTSGTSIPTLDLTGCNSLEGLYVQSNKNIYDLDLSPVKETLKVLNMSTTNVSEVNVADFSKLEEINLQNCKRLMTAVDVSASTELRVFRTDGTYVPSVDLSNCHKLYEVHVFSNELLTDFKIGDCPDLVYLNIFQTAIETLTLGESPVLKQLWAYSNPNLVRIDISKVNQNGPYTYYLDWNENLREIKVWSTFDINNPPSGIYKDDTASFVYEFSEE